MISAADPNDSKRHRLLRWLVSAFLLVALMWCAAALWIDLPAHGIAAHALAVVTPLAGLALLASRGTGWRGPAAAALVVAIVVAWWSLLEPRNDRDWLDDVARTPTATIVGNVVTVTNVRDFRYGDTDQAIRPHWETRSYDLDRLASLDLFISNWGPKLYVHTILSWGFTGGRPLAISIETRKEKGEEYSALKGFFRQYELVYVAADERDVIGVRAGPRRERIQLHRLRTTPEERRALLMEYLKAMNRVAAEPQWYHALWSNCTTEIWKHVHQVVPDAGLDLRVLVNGGIAALLRERGRLDTTVPLAQLEADADITAVAAEARDDDDFSSRIRRGLRGFSGTR